MDVPRMVHVFIASEHFLCQLVFGIWDICKASAAWFGFGSGGCLQGIVSNDRIDVGVTWVDVSMAP
jgi:hypothetical protein